MKQISIVLRSLEKTQKTTLIKNQIEKHNLNVTIFTMTRSHNEIDINKSCMPITNIYYNWDNILIATNFDEAIFVSEVPTNSHKIFYIWNLDWSYNGLSYKIMKSCIDKFDLVICRSEYHKKIIDSQFNIDSKIIEDFNLKEIYDGTDTSQ